VDDGGSGPRTDFFDGSQIGFISKPRSRISGISARLSHSATPAAAMSRARWVGERTVDTVTVPVPVQVDLREATIEADIRSPGLSRPMRRTYTYIHTPDAAAAWGAEIAEEVHEENLESRLKVERAFEDAEAEQKRIENKRRARECAARNKQKYGTARKPKARDASAATPRTGSAPVHASVPSKAVHDCLCEPGSSNSPVEKRLRLA
jgi:hypothetical protein